MYNVTHKDSGSRQRARVRGKAVDVPVYEMGDVVQLPIGVYNLLDDRPHPYTFRLPQRLQNRSRYSPRTSTPKQYRGLLV